MASIDMNENNYCYTKISNTKILQTKLMQITVLSKVHNTSINQLLFFCIYKVRSCRAGEKIGITSLNTKSGVIIQSTECGQDLLWGSYVCVFVSTCIFSHLLKSAVWAACHVPEFVGVTSYNVTMLSQSVGPAAPDSCFDLLNYFCFSIICSVCVSLQVVARCQDSLLVLRLSWTVIWEWNFV